VYMPEKETLEREVATDYTDEHRLN
jgi:hypothetical protein